MHILLATVFNRLQNNNHRLKTGHYGHNKNAFSLSPTTVKV